MKRIRRSMLLSLGLILTACLLAGAAAGGHLEKKCYNDSGDEIPCADSNYYETQVAARATARHSGQAVPAVAASPTPSPTPSPTATPTSIAAPTQSPMPTLMQAQGAAAPAASAAQEVSGRPSAIMVLILVSMLGFAGVLVVTLVFMIFRWLSSRRNMPPGPPT